MAVDQSVFVAHAIVLVAVKLGRTALKSSPFPKIPLGETRQSVSLTQLIQWWQCSSGSSGTVWVENVLYEGASDVHAPDFESKSFLTLPVFSGLNLIQSDEDREYFAYVENETRTQWGVFSVDQIDKFPLEEVWEQFADFRMKLALQPPGIERLIFSFEPNELITYQYE